MRYDTRAQAEAAIAGLNGVQPEGCAQPIGVKFADTVEDKLNKRRRMVGGPYDQPPMPPYARGPGPAYGGYGGYPGYGGARYSPYGAPAGNRLMPNKRTLLSRSYSRTTPFRIQQVIMVPHRRPTDTTTTVIVAQIPTMAATVQATELPRQAATVLRPLQQQPEAPAASRTAFSSTICQRPQTTAISTGCSAPTAPC